MSMDLVDYDGVPSIQTNLGPVLKRWSENKRVPVTRKGIGPSRLRTRFLKRDCWGKARSRFGRFCSFYCSKGRCRGCAAHLVKDARGKCVACGDSQTREWMKCPKLGDGQEGETEWVDLPLYRMAQDGQPLDWPFCQAKRGCLYHTCKHVCERQCSHECSLECRVHKYPEERFPFGCDGCTCPSEWIE